MPLMPVAHVVETEAEIELAYVEFTSNATITQTVEASANEVVSAGSLAFDGSTRVQIEFFSSSVQSVLANQSVDIWLFDDSSSIGKLAGLFSSDALDVSVHVARFMTPSNASHTYSIRATRSGGTNIVVRGGAGGAGNLMPGFIRITSGGSI